MTIEQVLAAVAEERARWVAGFGAGAPPTPQWTAERWLAELGRHVGHVCRVRCVPRDGLMDRTLDLDLDLRHELVQVVAVCGAWAEALGAPGSSFAKAVAANAPYHAAQNRLRVLMRAVGEIGTPPRVNGLRRVAELAVAWAASLEPTAKEGERDATP